MCAECESDGPNISSISTSSLAHVTQRHVTWAACDSTTTRRRLSCWFLEPRTRNQKFTRLFQFKKQNKVTYSHTLPTLMSFFLRLHEAQRRTALAWIHTSSRHLITVWLSGVTSGYSYLRLLGDDWEHRGENRPRLKDQIPPTKAATLSTLWPNFPTVWALVLFLRQSSANLFSLHFITFSLFPTKTVLTSLAWRQQRNKTKQYVLLLSIMWWFSWSKIVIRSIYCLFEMWKSKQAMAHVSLIPNVNTREVEATGCLDTLHVTWKKREHFLKTWTTWQ